MRLYKLMTLLRRMVQWFKKKELPCDGRLLTLNYDALSEAQNKALVRLVRFKAEAAFQIVEDYIFASYQMELIGVHRIKSHEPTAHARHLGRVDALFSVMRALSEVKASRFNDEEDKRKNEERKRARSGSRPVI